MSVVCTSIVSSSKLHQSRESFSGFLFFCSLMKKNGITTIYLSSYCYTALPSDLEYK